MMAVFAEAVKEENLHDMSSFIVCGRTGHGLDASRSRALFTVETLKTPGVAGPVRASLCC
jgi:hypothetical protein